MTKKQTGDLMNKLQLAGMPVDAIPGAVQLEILREISETLVEIKNILNPEAISLSPVQVMSE